MEVACEARTGAYAQHLKWLTSTAPGSKDCGPLDTPTRSIRSGLHIEVDTSTRSRDAFTPEQCNNLALGKTKRAQGMPGDDLTHGPPAIKKQAGSHHRFGRINRHSLRDGLRLISRSPRGPGFLAPVMPEKLASQELDLSVGRPGPRDFTVRASHVRLTCPPASIASLPHVS
jgi:hypothetical protein